VRMSVPCLRGAIRAVRSPARTVSQSV
jgi:hypothetical protein